MAWMVDSSTLISLARSGLLGLIPRLPIDLGVLDVVREEAVVQGRLGGHVDAQVIEALLEGWVDHPAPRGLETIDAAVLAAASAADGLVSNDLALGRRARNLSIPWLRTADLVILAVRASTLAPDEGRLSIDALEASGRLSSELATAYRSELS